MAASKMKKILSVWVLLSIAVSSLAYDELSKPALEADEIPTLVDILELEYEDQCGQLADARWAALLNPTKSFQDKVRNI